MPKKTSPYKLSQPASYDPSSASFSTGWGQECTAVIGSMTRAMQAERVLAGASVRSYVTKVSSAPSGGCVYGVSYACNQASLVRDILSHAGVRVRKYM